MTIDGFTGVHTANKNYIDVRGTYIQNTNTKYIAANIGLRSNLTALIVQNSNLIEIKAENFFGLQELEYLNLYANKITSLSSDTFSTLTKLKYLILSSNQLEVIPFNLFSNNLNLEFIDLYNNKIKYVGSGVFDEMKKLKVVYLFGNICVNENFINIIQLKEDMKSRCNNPNE